MAKINQHHLLSLAAAFALAPAAALAQTDCTALLTGRWASKGDFNMGFKTIKVDNLFALNADRTFKTDQKYLGDDGKWQRQVVTGTWSARPGKAADACEIVMESKHEGGSSSSTSTVTIVDRNTYRSFGMDARRVR